jgi:hypothetical protein
MPVDVWSREQVYHTRRSNTPARAARLQVGSTDPAWKSKYLSTNIEEEHVFLLRNKKISIWKPVHVTKAWGAGCSAQQSGATAGRGVGAAGLQVPRRVDAGDHQ